MPAPRIFERAPGHIPSGYSDFSVRATRGTVMHQAVSQGQIQPSQHRPLLAAGFGVALAGAALAIVVLMSNGSSPVVVADGASNGTSQCQLLQRRLLVSTTSSGGTVRLREGNYLSPPIRLGAEPQAVVFPVARPELTPVEEVLTIEGNARDVVLTSDVTPLRKVFSDVSGLAAFSLTWKPMKTC